ncbi:aminotransferase class V-fold PLP-dependent enzyme [Candidatus Saccharibacteria bacterium]|jgi:complete genome|nr:aminotransferase class V-fold PLP-dependent enzyme [Candidatus Saccharibacteria bacterium]
MYREEFEIFELAPELIDPMMPFVYLDSAATMQRPKQVIEKVSEYYKTLNANPLRGLYKISEQSTRLLNQTRTKVAEYIGAGADEVIFTKNATEAINLVANGVRELIGDGKILISLDSHHSNILPFTERYGERVLICEDVVTEYMKLKSVGEQSTDVKIVALTGLSNVTGNEQIETVQKLRKVGFNGLILLDAAQLIAHRKINLEMLDVDFLAFSGHKIGAPMGIGVLYMRRELMEKVKPLNYGGEMVDAVEIAENSREAANKTSDSVIVRADYAFGPQKFEGGTIDMGGVVGLLQAISFWNKNNKGEELFAETRKLTEYAVEKLSAISDLELFYGKNGIILFNIKGVHPHDTAQILSNYGVMVRAGWHCAEPVLTKRKIGPAVRVSLMFYNTKSEINYLVSILGKIRKEMGL